MYVEALKNNEIKGILNGTSPYPVSNADFTKVLGEVLHRPAFLPAPAFAIKLAFGEMSQILLEGQKVLPVKFKEAKFKFRYPTLEMAIKESVK
jgi:NAD dependent epimerase/dehydratase family enzyme